MPVGSVTTAAGDSDCVRVQVVTPPNGLSREGQIQLTKEITNLISNAAGDPSLAQRTWVLLSEATEGGWGIAGTAYGRDEFIALAVKAKQAAASG